MTNSHHPLAWAQMARNARDYQISTAVAEIGFGATGDDLKRRGFTVDIIDAAQERFVREQPEETK